MFLCQMLTVTQAGDVQIRDTVGGKILCQIKLPDNCEILTPWEPILALGSEGQILYVKGTVLNFSKLKKITAAAPNRFEIFSNI